MKILDIPQSGKEGLNVSYKGRNGQVRRAYVVPANPKTIAQLSVRANLTNTGHAYRALTAAQQDAWSTAAARYRTRSRLGQSGPMTGYQLYAKINCTLRQFGQDPVDVPPGPPNTPAVAPTALVIANNQGVVTLTLACPGNPGQNTIIRASAPQGSGVRSMPATYIIGTCPAPAAGSADITALYNAKFGLPAAGDRVFVEANTMLDGWEGPRMAFTALTPAA